MVEVEVEDLDDMGEVEVEDLDDMVEVEVEDSDDMREAEVEGTLQQDQPALQSSPAEEAESSGTFPC